jgi:hypothetical protein
MKPQSKTKKVTRKTTAAPLVVAEAKPATAKAAAPITLTPARPAQTKPTVIKAAEPVALTPSRPAQTKSAATKAAETVIEAKVDVGFGNQLFVRGQGAGLSWERGTPLTCVDGKTWRWVGASSERLTFKVLLNDKVWAAGEDVVVTPGNRVEIVPAF